MFQPTHPVWGATIFFTTRTVTIKFQSTHPVWGATRMWCTWLQEHGNFNPRTPCGVRPKAVSLTMKKT